MLRLTSRRVTARPLGATVRPLRPFSALTDEEVARNDELMTPLVDELIAQQKRRIEALVPWFKHEMPRSYFIQVRKELRLEHLRNLVAAFDPIAGFPGPENEASSRRLTMGCENPVTGGHDLTFICFGAPGGEYQDELVRQFNRLPTQYGEFQGAKFFISNDRQLCINIYSFGDFAPERDPNTRPDAEHVYAFAQELKDDPSCSTPGLTWSDKFEREELDKFFAKCSDSFLYHSSARFLLQQKLLVDGVFDSELVGVHTERADSNLPGLLAIKEEGNEGDIMSIELQDLLRDYHVSNTQIASVDKEGSHWFKLAITNAAPDRYISKILWLIKSRNLAVLRMFVDVMPHEQTGNITLLRLLVVPTNPDFDQSQTTWVDNLAKEMKQLKWTDLRALSLALNKVKRGDNAGYHTELGLDRAEIVSALSDLMHPLLSTSDPYRFSKANIASCVQAEPRRELVTQIADLLKGRFHYVAALRFSQEEYDSAKDALHQRIKEEVADAGDRTIFYKMIDAVDMTKKTNLFVPTRMSLSLRLDGELFRPVQKLSKNGPKAVNKDGVEEKWEVPFGVFFVHGRRFNGFHVRFRDIARGGMRLNSPASAAEHQSESTRHFNVAYDLAFAQQLKNKDIPEGGSKAVVLIDNPDKNERILRWTAKAFVNSLLDLLKPTGKPTGKPKEEYVHDKLGLQEQLFLGPDERVTTQDIVSVLRQAKEADIDSPDTFMSSDATTGFNHKIYGVTSEGVQVFFDVALRRCGLEPAWADPSQPLPDGFTYTPVTVKISGGPDGDVAGNMIKILYREYIANNALKDAIKIVAIADGSGCVEDRNGLDWQELRRLCPRYVENIPEEDPADPSPAPLHDGLTVASFDVSTLSSEGELHLANNDYGARMRDTMHNRVQADVFVPGGGKPDTVTGFNYTNFLREDGKPSSPLVVEGANLFFSKNARELLFDKAGVHIVKDSSANKCGVICSSFEILSRFLLEEDELTNGEIRRRLIRDVKTKLRQLALAEAEVLWREYEADPKAMQVHSLSISNAVNATADAIFATIGSKPEHEAAALRQKLKPLLLAHMPDTLREIAGDRVDQKLTQRYVDSALSAALAAQIVYAQGTAFVKPYQNEPKRLGELAIDYFDFSSEVTDLAAKVEELPWGSEEQHLKQMAVEIIQHGGASTLLARGHRENFEK